jgi:hypothetical protein
MDYAQLKQTIADSMYDGKTDQEIADALNAVVKIVPGTMVNERTILSAFANPVDGEAFLEKLEAVGTVNKLMARALT